MSHTVVLGDMFLHCDEHTHTVNPSYTVLLPQILSRAYSFTAKNSSQQCTINAKNYNVRLFSEIL